MKKPKGRIFLTSFIFAFAWACDTTGPEPPDILGGTDLGTEVGTDTQQEPLCVDDDSDGACEDVDCDDADPTVSPLEFEIAENGKDDDCDDKIDENTYHADGLPTDVTNLFAGAEDPGRQPSIVYPAENVLLPPNVSGIVFQWEPGAGNDLWMVQFDGDGVDAVAYVSEARFAPDEAFWQSLTGGNLNKSVRVTVQGTTQGAPTSKGTSAPLTIAFAEESVQGGLYYWAATSTTNSDYGIMRYDFADPTQTQAEPIYTLSQAGRCVACHALSHDGTRMALNYDGGGGIADIIDIATRTSTVPAGSEYYANFHTFSPDDAYLLSVSQGKMTLRDGKSGASIETLAMDRITYPDWSPNGVQVVFTRSTRTNCGYADWHFDGGQIEVMDFLGPDNWSTPRVLVPAGQDVNNYYPAISPDGKWVVFNRSYATVSGKCDNTWDTYSDDTAELWVVSIDGGAPIRLDALNQGPKLRNSWAKWAPFEQSLGGETIFWLTTSSIRPYAPELPQGNLPQIWMSAFHVSKAEAGLDPSRPAFWLPCQDTTTNNHIPQWTTKVVGVI